MQNVNSAQWSFSSGSRYISEENKEGSEKDTYWEMKDKLAER